MFVRQAVGRNVRNNLRYGKGLGHEIKFKYSLKNGKFCVYTIASTGFCSVADPGCLSWIPDPDFYPSWISDPGSKNSNKREGEKKIDFIPFYVATNFTKLYITYLSFEVLKKKIWANFQRIIELFTQKIVTKLSKV